MGPLNYDHNKRLITLIIITSSSFNSTIKFAPLLERPKVRSEIHRPWHEWRVVCQTKFSASQIWCSWQRPAVNFNFTNILQAAFSLISFCQKNYCKYRNAEQNTYVWIRCSWNVDEIDHVVSISISSTLLYIVQPLLRHTAYGITFALFSFTNKIMHNSTCVHN